MIAIIRALGTLKIEFGHMDRAVSIVLFSFESQIILFSTPSS